MRTSEARARQHYDPEKRIYDYRKKWVTDMEENGRVTLPKPLKPIDEAGIEMRRDVHWKVFREYRDENCGDKGE